VKHEVVVIWLSRLALVFGLLSSTLVHSEEPIVWGYAPFPPYIYPLSDGQPAGPFADIVIKTLNHAGIDYLPLYTPNKRARKAINDGLTDFSIGPLAVLNKPENYHISDTAVAKVDMRTFWIGPKPAIKKTSDFNGKSVILITSFQYSGLRQYLENPVNNVSIAVNVEDHKRALSALNLKRADYMLGYLAPVDLMQLEMGIADLQSYPIKQADFHLFINKAVKDSRQIMDKINTAYAELYLQDNYPVIVD
jgi:polar amino acid transport system substrate-binding protein